MEDSNTNKIYGSLGYGKPWESQGQQDINKLTSKIGIRAGHHNIIFLE